MITALTICTVAVIVMLWSVYYTSRDKRKYHEHYLIEADTQQEAESALDFMEQGGWVAVTLNIDPVTHKWYILLKRPKE